MKKLSRDRRVHRNPAKGNALWLARIHVATRTRISNEAILSTTTVGDRQLATTSATAKQSGKKCGATFDSTLGLKAMIVLGDHRFDTLKILLSDVAFVMILDQRNPFITRLAT